VLDRHTNCSGPDVAADHRWTTFGAARRFEEAAQDAEKQRNYRLAARLYRAALLVLKGDSLDDGDALVDAGCIASACDDVPRWGALPRPPSNGPAGKEPEPNS
jgi:hypothetical protein